MSETAVNGVEPIIFLDDVHVTFRTRTGSILHPNLVHAVQGVTIKLMPGQTIGIVGESGCGKSTTANVMCHISVMQHIMITTIDASVAGNTSGSVTEKRLRTKRPVLGLIRLVTIAVLNIDFVDGTTEYTGVMLIVSGTGSIFTARRLIISYTTLYNLL